MYEEGFTNILDFPEIGIDTKFTRAMEEIFLTLIFLCIIRNEWSAKGLVQKLITLTDRTPKTVGVTLEKLADLSLIKYTNDGRGKKVTINLPYEFVQVVLVFFFGFAEEEYKRRKQQTFPVNNGIFPANLNFEKTIALLEKLILETDEEIKEYSYYLEWISEQYKWQQEVSEIDLQEPAEAINNPLYQFAEDLVSKFERETSHYADGLTFQRQKKIILEKLEIEKEQLPWAFEPNLQKNFRIDEL